MARDVTLFDLETGRAANLGQHHNWLSSIAFSPDGRLLASGGQDRMVTVWEVASGKLLRQLTGHGDSVSAVVFAPDGWSVATASADRTVRVWKLVDGAASGDDALLARQLDASWIDLGNSPEQAYRAIRRLLADPAQGVAVVAKQIEGSAALTAEQIDRLVEDLDNSVFATRQQAMRRLEAEGKAVEPALRRALANGPSLEMTRRIEQLLPRLNQPSADWLRKVRAVQVLERADTTEARRVLRALAGGPAGPPLSVEAKAALRRLKTRGAAAGASGSQ
jgi:hypothetical protein